MKKFVSGSTKIIIVVLVTLILNDDFLSLRKNSAGIRLLLGLLTPLTFVSPFSWSMLV